MNIPFPDIKPDFMFPDLFNADRPYDEDAELTKLEQSHKEWLTSFSKRYEKHPVVHKSAPEPVEKAETERDDHAGNEDEEESDDSHDEEHIPTVEPEPQNNEDQANIELELVSDDSEPTTWPYRVRNE